MVAARRRWLVGAGATLAALFAAAAAATVSAQEPPAPTLQTAKATAVAVRVVPSIGNLELALGSGIAVAELRNDVAQAQSESLDLGLIGTALTGEQCDGRDPILRPEQLPQPLTRDNRGGDVTAEASVTPMAGAPISAAHQFVRTTVQPLSEAVSTSALAALSPALGVSAGQAEARTELRDGTRIAEASVEMSLDIAGLVSLTALRWDAEHRTGADPGESASFTIGDLRVLGTPVPTLGLALEDLLAQLNGVLVPLGVRIELPTVEQFDEPADLIRVSPLRITVTDSPLGFVLGPVFDATRSFRDDLAAQLIDIYCRTAIPLLVSEITLAQLFGTGTLSIDIGGAEATTGEAVLEDPFATDPLPTEEPLTSPEAAAPPVVPAAPPAAPRPPEAPAARTEPPTQPAGAFERVCESVHPFDWPSCSTGAAPLVGLLGIGATVGIAALDWRRHRKRAAATS